MPTVATLYTWLSPDYWHSSQNAPFLRQYVDLQEVHQQQWPLAGLGIYGVGEIKGVMRNYTYRPFVFVKINGVDIVGDNVQLDVEPILPSGINSSQIYDRLKPHRLLEFHESNKIIQILQELGVNSPDEWLRLIPGMPPDNKLDPRFFETLTATIDWREFENYTYYLLKVLGIHNLHKFSRNNQRGKSDGFFIFKNLVVIFDMTLEQNYQEVKREQIKNFCSQLQRGEISHNNQTYRTGERTKQVWIITKRAASQILERIEEVSVKEVSINDLIKLYRKRLTDNLNEEALETTLKNIGT